MGCSAEGAGESDESASASGSTDAGSTSTAEGEAAAETSGDSDGSDTSGTGTTGEDPMLDDADFTCILDWPKVRGFRVTNVLGDVDATLAVANSPTGGTYPVGSLLQLVPTEAMLKRAPGFAPQANDWEFFSLDVDANGATILDRGSDTVVNAFGGNCFDCHEKAEPQWDFICEQTHGCDPLPLTSAQLEATQNSDPRCG